MPPAEENRLIFGTGPVRELLKRRPERVVSVLLTADHSLEADAKTAGIRVERIKKEAIEKLVGPYQNHQGVVAKVKPFEFAELEDVIAPSQDRAALLLALDGITDPHNLGAILRSAYLFGVDGVVVTKDRAAPINATVAKSSAGASELVPVVRVVNLARSLDQVKEEGLWSAAVAARKHASPLPEFDATGGLVLVLGSEGKGLRPLVEKRCDFHIEIPMLGRGVGSLNVSVATGVVLYEVMRQRTRSGK